MKTFNQFINENVSDLLIGKSYDELVKALDGLSDNGKILYIIKYQLDFDLLPRNEEGRCIFDYELYIDDMNIYRLPDNLTVNDCLYCANNPLTELPKGLKVELHLDCSNCKLTELPKNLYVGYNFWCDNNQLTSLPDNLTVKGSLHCQNNKVKLKLPSDAKIGGKFYN